jgi:hypothetical protein
MRALLDSLAEEASKRLSAAGFTRLSERASWGGLKRGGKYYFTRNASTIVAFAVGARYEAGNGFHMVGAHTDRRACCFSSGGCHHVHARVLHGNQAHAHACKLCP